MLITATWPEFSGTECSTPVWGVLNRDVLRPQGAGGESSGGWQRVFWEAVGRQRERSLTSHNKAKVIAYL